ncbi:MAG: SusC/RagA family TonB-linked outer membrane protein [Bacteroidales bacterium]|jgi:TonB-linked SusC/RagA family outer membrane protein|nr:SusC/RagA family TonB-linked outer membrane protein [Bacteroidales bacterium]
MKYNIRKKHQQFAGWLPAVIFFLTANPGVFAGERDSLVFVAYGEQRKERVVSSVSTVSGEDLGKSQVSTLGNTFFGRFPGMTVIQTNGEPGYDEASVYLRGQHTLQSNTCIILVDGFQVDAFSQISAEEIESISYLKDAAALALYGISSANGALLITTKKGKNTGKKTNISLKARYGLHTPAYLPKFEGSYNYALLYNEALQNDGLPVMYGDKDLQGYLSGSDPYYYPDVNWYDEILSKTSDIQDYSLSFTGGNLHARYFVMAGFMGYNGLYDGTDQKINSNINFKRINFRANVDVDVNSDLSFRMNLGGRIEDRMFPNTATATMWQHMATYAPNLYPVRTPDGKITGTASYPDNPVGSVLEEGYGSRHTRNVQAAVTAKEKLSFLADGLSVFASIAFGSNYQNGYNKQKTYAYYEPIKTISGTGQDSIYYVQRGADTDLTVSTGNDAENNRMEIHAGLEYEQSFGQHDLKALLMYRQSKRSNFTEQSAYAKRDFLGRIDYALRDKYLAELSLAYSGTDNYRPGRRFGFFPALGLGWVLSKEDFLQNLKPVDYLKIRGSAGLLGNDQGAARFAYNQYWGPASSQGYYFGTGVTYYEALVQQAVANPDFTWEKALLYNIGLETELFNRRLSFTADYFFEDRYDIPVSNTNTLPSFSGITFSTMLNRAEVNNRGIELSTTWRDRAGNTGYFAGAQFSFIRNKIVESFEAPHREAARYTQGHSVGQRYGLEAVGFFRDDTDIALNPVHTFSNVRPGDLKYKDQNKDGFINVDDEVPIGKPSVPEITFSVNTGITWKGFDLELLFDGNANRNIYLNGYMFWPFINDYNISTWAAERRWTPETHSEAAFPRLTTQANPNNYRASDFWVRNIYVLRLRNAELGYNFSGNWLNRAKIEKLRVYVSTLNLLTLSNLDADVDPETLSVGYPTLKTFSVGINLNF